MEGCGNDFLVAADLNDSKINWQAITPRIMHRNFGIGGDGVMIVIPSQKADFGVAMFNPDGSLMGMCGNGIRCVTRFVIDNKIVPNHQKVISFDVEGRLITCETSDGGKSVRVDMGKPSFKPQDIPVFTTHEMIQAPLFIEGNEYEVSCVSVGNPHCVVFVSDVARVPLHHVGPLVENHQLFPKRINAEFVEVVSRNHMKIRVWERGAGVTLACGTAACASLVCAAKAGRSDRKAKIDLSGGSVQVEWDAISDHVYLTGPTRIVYKGELIPNNFI